MWKAVSNKDWPVWAVDVVSVWQDNAGHWLSNKKNDHSVLWEVRSSEGKVIANQMDLPFKEELDGLPTTWANKEIASRKERFRAEH